MLDTDDNSYFAWMYLSEDKNTAIVSVLIKVRTVNESRKRIYLKGLEEESVYECEGKKYYGSTLMHVGI